MARYIDADALGIGYANLGVFEKTEYAKGWNSAIAIIQDAPTVDAVPVVRCKDCEYNKIGSCEHSEQHDDLRYRPDYFCADGERRNDV